MTGPAGAFVLLIAMLMLTTANTSKAQATNGKTYRSSIRPTPHDTVATGARAAIAVTSASAAAKEILDDVAGGRLNAVDAAISIALSQIVASGGSWVSLSGILTAIIYDPSTGAVTTIDAGYRVPTGEANPGRTPGQAAHSGRGVLTPGFLAGVEALHDRFGHASWSEIVRAPIRLARDGVAVSENLSTLINYRSDSLARTPEIAAVFLPGGTPLEPGQIMKQPGVENLLDQMAASGPGALLRGEWAQRYAAAAQAAGGTLTARDIAENKPDWKEADALGFGAFKVRANSDQLGGRCLLDALKWLDDMPPGSSHSEAERWELMIRASHRCYVLAQTDRRGPVPKTENKTASVPLADRLTGPTPRPPHSDVVAVTDPDGMIVVLCHSINTTAWGELGLFVDGVALPDSASFQQRLLRRLGPGDRVPNALVSAIVTRDGHPVLATGAIGASVSEAMLQTTYSLLTEPLDLATALERPQILKAIWPAIGWFQVALGVVGGVLFVTGSIAALGLPVLQMAVALLTCLASATFAVGVVFGGIMGCHGCIAAVDFPRVYLVLGAVGVAVALFGIVTQSSGFTQHTVVLIAMFGAVILPVLLRGSLVPVNVVLPSTLPDGTIKALSGRQIALREVGTDPPFGYVAGVQVHNGSIEAAVSETSLDGGAHAQ